VILSENMKADSFSADQKVIPTKLSHRETCEDFKI